MTINKKIENVIGFIRDARDEADGLEESILFFVVFLFIGVGIALMGYMFVMLAFTFPHVIIPIYFTIFILWQGYKRL